VTNDPGPINHKDEGESWKKEDEYNWPSNPSRSNYNTA
jgi:hypothetical protein